VVPYGDPGYRSLRGDLAFEKSDLVALTDEFALTPGLAPLRDLYRPTRRPKNNSSP
jgi:uncharacterized protein (DUF1501 family)